MAAVILVWEEKESLTCELCWVTSLALRGWRTSPGSVWLAGMGAALLSCRNGDILSASRSCIKQFLQIRLQKCENLHEAMVILARVWAMLMNEWHKAVSQIWIALYLWHFLVLLASSTRQCFNIFLLNPTVCLTAALVLGTQMLSSLILFIHCCDYTQQQKKRFNFYLFWK